MGLFLPPRQPALQISNMVLPAGNCPGGNCRRGTPTQVSLAGSGYNSYPVLEMGFL